MTDPLLAEVLKRRGRTPVPPSQMPVTPAETPTECVGPHVWVTLSDRGQIAWCARLNQPLGFEHRDARIRELEATVQSAIRIYRQVESERRPNGKGLSPFFFGQRLRRLIREWVELSEAALARSEGGSK